MFCFFRDCSASKIYQDINFVVVGVVVAVVVVGGGRFRCFSFYFWLLPRVLVVVVVAVGSCGCFRCFSFYFWLLPRVLVVGWC